MLQTMGSVTLPMLVLTLMSSVSMKPSCGKRPKFIRLQFSKSESRVEIVITADHRAVWSKAALS